MKLLVPVQRVVDYTVKVRVKSDVIRVAGAVTFERPTHAGNAIAAVQAADPAKVITMLCVARGIRGAI